MNASTLKILVPLVLLMGVVFAITYFSQYTPTERDDKIPEKVETVKSPLRFTSGARFWNPIDPRHPEQPSTMMDHFFPGYFEPGETQYNASFWFENRNAAPVTLQLSRVSCSSCSGGEVAAIPPDVTRQILQITAISTLPQGFASALPIGLAIPTAQFDRSRNLLSWQAHEFSKPAAEVLYTIPAAPSGDNWVEPWAILNLKFKVRSGSHGPLVAEFFSKLQGSDDAAVEKFGIGFEAAAPFEFEKSLLDIGELTEGSAPQTHEVLVYSSTRQPHEMPKLDVLVMMPTGVSGEPGPFIAAGTPIPIPENQLEDLAIKISTKEKKPIRVQSAFRIPITVKVQIDRAKLDIGAVDRVVAVTQGTESKQLRVKGSMRGPVYLASGVKEIGYGIFAFSSEQTAIIEVETERSGVELEIVKDLTQPKFLKLELIKQPDNGERGSYKLKATIPAKEQIGEIRNGVVVLEAKGPSPQRLRIPVTGRGRE